MTGLQSDPRELIDRSEFAVEFDGLRLVYGRRSLARIGDETKRLGCRSVLLVTDPGLRTAGHVGSAVEALEREAIRVAVFDGVVENPSSREVEQGRRRAAAVGIDGIVGLGGGSVLDCAKGINFVLTNGGSMEDYWGRDKASAPLLPSIGLPTTAGTGSEAQSFALISHPDTGAKMACGDPKARFRTVILDPEVLGSVSSRISGVTGIDAVAHAIESYVSTARNAESQLLAREAWRLLDASLESCLSGGESSSTCGPRLLGSFFAGAAIEHSMLGAAHACANPLTTSHAVAHGIAVGLMLPHVIRFNRSEVDSLYAELESAVGSSLALEDRFVELRRHAGLPASLSEVGVPRKNLGRLADDAARQWTAGYNPRAVTRDDLLELYEAAY